MSMTDFFMSGPARLGGHGDGVHDDDLANGEVDVEDVVGSDVDDAGEVDFDGSTGCSRLD